MPRRLLLPAVALAGALSFAACGSSSSSSSTAASTPATTAGSTTSAGSTPAASALPKPTVKLPATMPTELVTTVIKPGTGAAAESGDIVVVRYVGARSEDGTEFDDNYDGNPFPVSLGAGSVIKGWDQGLVGVQTGEQLQLDIPADLAYGDTPSGEIIKPGDALSFVIDVLAVVPAVTAADQPQITVTPGENRSDLVVTDLVEGTGAELQAGQTAVLHLTIYRGDTGEQVFSTWTEGQPLGFAYKGSQEISAGLTEGMEGMKVGGRRQLTIPYEQAFSTDDSSALGIPESTDVVAVVDLVAAY